MVRATMANAMRERLAKKMVGPAVKREAVVHLQARMGLSERRACAIVGADRKVVRYQSRRPSDAALRGRLRELANERRRFGYRRLYILLRREGEPSGINRIFRLYQEEGLAVRKRRARRKAVGTRARILTEARPNARWSLDFLHDQFSCGRLGLQIAHIAHGLQHPVYGLNVVVEGCHGLPVSLHLAHHFVTLAE